MKKVLITCIGKSDTMILEGKTGPILDILTEREFDVLRILYDAERYLLSMSAILEYCRRKHPKLVVRYDKAIVTNATDYKLVYPAMVTAVQGIIKEEGENDVEYTISVTSGTPVMHSCWILMSMEGKIKAKLVQTSKGRNLEPVNLVLDDFPQITSPHRSKILLTLSERENKMLRQQLMDDFPGLLGTDKSIDKVRQQIAMLSGYDVPVSITGESGTGKEVVAKLIHQKSTRQTGPFVAVNCGAISPHLFESELFGHKKGSFTGAIADHEGFFQQADKGTLFLDEIGDLPQPMQVKLLRVLQEGEITPVGGKSKKVNVRLISASLRDLAQMVEEGTFREDLYHRLVLYDIALPPLRERGMDIILLGRHFLQGFAEKTRQKRSFSPEAERKLLSFTYPGNVRQLQNIVCNASIRTLTGEIGEEDIILPVDIQQTLKIDIPDEGIDLDNVVIPAYYQEAMRKSGNNAAAAARLLNLEPPTLRARLKKTPIKQ